MHKNSDFAKISTGLYRSGFDQVYDADAKVIFQEGIKAPVVKESEIERENKLKKEKTESNKAITVQDVERVEIHEAPLVSSQEDELANEIVKKLTETGLIIKNVLTFSPHEGNDPQIYYEVVSKAGDTFLLHIVYNSQASITYIPASGEGATSKSAKQLMRAKGQLLPVKTANVSECASDPICSRVFSCSDGGDGGCYARNQQNVFTDVEKYYTPEASTGGSIMKYSGQPIGYPVFSYFEYIADPEETTKKVIKETREIQQKALNANKEVISDMESKLKVHAQINGQLLDAFKSAGDSLDDQSRLANEYIKIWSEKGGPSTVEEKIKFDSLVSRRMSFNQFVSNLVIMSGELYESMESLHDSKQDSIKKYTKLWAQSKLRLDRKTSAGGSSWLFPNEFETLSMTDLENIFSGDFSKLNETTSLFLKSSKDTLDKLIKDVYGSSSTNLSTGEDLKRFANDLHVNTFLKNSDESVVKLLYQILAVKALYDLVEAVFPSLKIKIDKEIDHGICEDGKTCLNYDKETHKMNLKAGGNLPSFASYRQTEQINESGDAEKANIDVMSNYTSVIDKIISET